MSITADLPNIRVRFEPEVLDLLRMMAEHNERSVAAEVRWIVKRYIDEAQRLLECEAPK